MKDVFLFVYGTLRRDIHSEAHRLLTRSASFVSEATYQGRLYMVAHYPGVVSSENPLDIVRGDVYRLREPGLVLSWLDDYEECASDFPDPREYIRVMQEVRLTRGQRLQAWIYLYDRPTEDLQAVPSGDFLKLRGAP